ncbi:hypothetical protein N9154_00425 [Akkermansiaceae bacterium]|nr:hypothetical protein [Akkermansiaceae bacterium]
MLQGTNYANGTITSKITRRTFQSGLIIETGDSDDHVIKIFCPLIITDEKLKRGLDIIEEALATVCGRNDEYPTSTSTPNGSPILLFEGTYTTFFSGNPTKTPHYDYIQILYRRDLDDSALAEAQTSARR